MNYQQKVKLYEEISYARDLLKGAHGTEPVKSIAITLNVIAAMMLDNAKVEDE